MRVRLIAPDWLVKASNVKRVLEADLNSEEIKQYNQQGYNVYYTPNSASQPPTEGFVDGTFIDTFTWVFVDFDLKSNTYDSKEAFLEKLFDIEPTKIVDSGNGIHGYYKVSDLDAKSYLKLSRRLMRYFNTDEAVGQIFQLMRLEGTINTKSEYSLKQCDLLLENGPTYTCEQLDKLLPTLTVADDQYCEQHYDKTYNIDRKNVKISDVMPPKFGKLLLENHEAQELWASNTEDRSKNDYRLGHIMFANGLTKDEAATVLANSSKALSRAPIHRISYAQNIVDKIWTFEQEPNIDLGLSSNVLEILQRSGDTLKGTRFPCYKYIDNTELGFRLGHVMGLVAGSGVGKTAMALNIFMGFVKSNPDYDHFFCPLEQTDKEIAVRWQAMCGDNTDLYSKVHVISNYDTSGTFRDLSLETIKTHILEFQKKTDKKVGCIVIDHIGVLCNTNKLGQDEGIKQIAKAMKGFAVETNTFLIMQSQTSREKAGVGDLELNKDAAFGTSVFENFCDFLITIWQPLKRVYELGAPTVMAFKFCKIRHKNQELDIIKEDKPYLMFFDPKSQILKEITADQKTSFNFFLGQATNKRKQDRKTELVEYTSIKVETLTEEVRGKMQ